MAELDETLETPSETETRIKDLSGKVKKASDERDTEKGLREAAEAKASEVERERDFYSGFSDVVASNPAARDHKDEILAKVKAGYTTEDATFAVLGKAGKLGGTPIERATAAGGSADISIQRTGEKSIAEMTQAERKAALMENEGDLRRILSPQMNGQ